MDIALQGRCLALEKIDIVKELKIWKNKNNSTKFNQIQYRVLNETKQIRNKIKSKIRYQQTLKE